MWQTARLSHCTSFIFFAPPFSFLEWEKEKGGGQDKCIKNWSVPLWRSVWRGRSGGDCNFGRYNKRLEFWGEREFKMTCLRGKVKPGLSPTFLNGVAKLSQFFKCAATHTQLGHYLHPSPKENHTHNQWFNVGVGKLRILDLINLTQCWLDELLLFFG